MKRLNKRRFGIALVLFLIVVFSFVLFTDKSEPEETIRIGYFRHSSELPFYVALENNYFKEEGVNVETVEVGVPESLTALIRGDIDVLPSYSFSYFFSYEAQDPGTLGFFISGGEIIEGETISAILVKEDSDINLIQELEGKIIGYDTTLDKPNVYNILDGAGIKNIKLEQVSREVAAEVIERGDIDAYYINEPYVTILTKERNTRVLVANPRATYIVNPYWSGPSVIIRKDSLYTKEEEIKAVVRAFDKAIDFIREHPEEARTMLPKYTALTPELAQESGIYFKAKSTEEVDVEKIQHLANLLYENGFVESEVDVRGMILEID